MSGESRILLEISSSLIQRRQTFSLISYCQSYQAYSS